MQHRSEETRAHIINAAYRLFSLNGYEATGVSEICKEAGVSKGAFYHHFPSKQAVFTKLLDLWLQMLDNGFRQVLNETQNIPQAILGMAAMAGTTFQTADVRILIMLEFWTKASRDTSVWQTAIAPYRNYQAYFAKLIQEGIAEGSFRPVDPGAASRCLEALAIGILMQAIFDPQATDWSKETVQSIQFLFDGLLKKE